MNNLHEILAEKMEQVQPHDGGRYFSAICPFPHNGHKESHPSMLVYEDGYHCKGCNRGGNNLQYLLSHVDKGYKYIETVKISKPNILPKWFSWGQRYGSIIEIVDAAHKNILRTPENQWWFKRRKIDQFIEDGAFGYLDGWALFPVLDQNGCPIDLVVRATKGKGGTKYVLANIKRDAPNIYVPNWNRVLASDTVYIVYGLVDSWSMESLELPCITGTTGKSLSPVQLKPLDKKWIIVPDRYEEDAAYHLANLLGWKARVNRIKYPSECKDPDDIRMKLGQDALRQYLSP